MLRKWLRHRRDRKVLRAIRLATNPVFTIWPPPRPTNYADIIRDLQRTRDILHEHQERCEPLDWHSEPSGD